MPDEIQMTSDVTPKTEIARKAGDYAFTVARLAADKTVAAVAKPEIYKQSESADSLEGTMRLRFTKLSEPQRKVAIAKTMPQLETMLPARRTSLGALTAVDLTAARDVGEQAAKLPVPKMNFASTAPPTVAAVVAAAQAAPAFRKLVLRLHNVTCVDETDWGWGPFKTEGGTDEIDLGGSSIDAVGDVNTIPRFRVHNFKEDGVVKTFTPLKPLVTFDLNEGTSWPKTYTAVVILSEVDMGNFPEFLNQLTVRLRAKVAEYIENASSGQGGLKGAALALVIKEAVTRALNKILDYLRRFWGDDVFPEQLVTIRIPSASTKFPRIGGEAMTHSSDRTLEFHGHGGFYTLRYDWQLVA